MNNNDRGWAALPPLVHSPVLTPFAWGGILEIKNAGDSPCWSTACSAGKDNQVWSRKYETIWGLTVK